MTRIRKGSFNASEFTTATSSDSTGKEGVSSEGDRPVVLQSGLANLERRGELWDSVADHAVLQPLTCVGT